MTWPALRSSLSSRLQPPTTAALTIRASQIEPVASMEVDGREHHRRVDADDVESGVERDVGARECEVDASLAGRHSVVLLQNLG